MSTVLDLSHRHASELRECADDAERARITELNLACNYIDVAGLSRGLASFTHVRVLSCCANNLTELPDISVLPLLEELDVANNYITSLARLAQAGAASSRLRLRRLDIRQNYIDSLAGIEQCRELQWLSISNNPLLDDVRALVPLPALATLHAFGVRCDPDALLDVVRQLASLRELTFACCVRDRALYERFVRRRVPQITVLDNRPLPAPGDDAPAGERDASDAALLEELRGLVRAGKRVRVASGVQRAAGGADAGE